MSIHMNDSAVYGTSWRRTVPMAILGLAAMSTLAGLARADVLASNLVYQGSPMQLSSTRVTGLDVGFGMSTMQSKNAAGVVTTKNVLSAGFATGSVNGMCLSQVQNVPLIGDVTIKLKVGDGNASTLETKAVNVQFDVASLRSNNSGVNLDGMVHIGVASSDITTLPGVDNPLGAPTGVGWFGLDASKGDLYEVRGRLHNVEIGGPMALPGLKITVVPGGSQCDADPLPN